MFTFQHPQLLWLLPLAALPPVLHLLSRTRPARIYLPTMRFLLQAHTPQSGRRRLQDRLLMAVRMTVIALLIIALSAPAFRPRGDNLITNNAKAAAIILDTSASMQSHAAAASSARSELTREYGEETTAIFDTAGAPSPHVLGWRAGRPAEALTAAAAWLRSHRASGEPHAVIISDFQASDWSSRLPALPAGTQIHFRQLPISAENLAVTDARVFPAGADQLRVHISVRNFGPQAVERAVILAIGSQEHRLPVTVNPESEASVSIVIPVPESAAAEARLETSDAFPADDRRVFWAEPPAAVRTLLILPDTADSAPTSRALRLFTENALSAADRERAYVRYEIQSLGSSALSLANLESTELIFLLGCAGSLNFEVLAKLRRLVEENGAALFVVPGNAPLADWRTLQQAGLLANGDVTLERTPAALGAVSSSSPLSRLFTAKAPSDLNLFYTKKRLRISAGQDEQAHLNWSDGTPALIERSCGAGRLYAFTFDFEPANSEFALTQSFLPVIRELTAQATASREAVLRCSCGDTPPKRHALDGTALSYAPQIDGSTPALAHAGAIPVEFNTPSSESVTAAADLAELRRILERPEESGAENTSVAADGPQPLPLRKWLLTGAALLLLIESLLIQKAAHHRRTKA